MDISITDEQNIFHDLYICWYENSKANSTQGRYKTIGHKVNEKTV